jgi:hypothetical protein
MATQKQIEAARARAESRGYVISEASLTAIIDAAALAENPCRHLRKALIAAEAEIADLREQLAQSSGAARAVTDEAVEAVYCGAMRDYNSDSGRKHTRAALEALSGQAQVPKPRSVDSEEARPVYYAAMLDRDGAGYFHTVNALNALLAARRERSEAEPSDGWTADQCVSISELLDTLDIDDGDLDVPTLWHAKLTNYVATAQRPEHKAEVASLKAFARVEQPEPSDADVRKWSEADRDAAYKAAMADGQLSVRACIVDALDAVAHRLRECFEAGFRTGEVTNAFVEDEMQESIGKFKARIIGLETQVFRLESSLKSAETDHAELEAELRAAREATGGEVTAYDNERSSLQYVLSGVYSKDDVRTVAGALDRVLTQRASCGSAPKAAAPDSFEDAKQWIAESFDPEVRKLLAAANARIAELEAKAAAPVAKGFDTEVPTCLSLPETFWRSWSYMLHAALDDSEECHQGNVRDFARHVEMLVRNGQGWPLAAASVPPVPAVPVERREASVLEWSKHKPLAAYNHGFAAGQQKFWAELDGKVLVEPLTSEERGEVEDCRSCHSHNVAVRDAKLDALLHILEKRFVIPQPTPAPVAAPKGRSAREIADCVRMALPAEDMAHGTLNELVALAERREVPSDAVECFMLEPQIDWSKLDLQAYEGNARAACQARIAELETQVEREYASTLEMRADYERRLAERREVPPAVAEVLAEMERCPVEFVEDWTARLKAALAGRLEGGVR